jgi:flagellar protein FliO/FliZ
MQWLDQLPFAENRVVQMGFLAACGIAALVVLAILYRLVFAHRLRVPGGRTRQPRLGLVDAFSLDGQRQLVLVRRDNVEHLVMIGGPNDVLVESQINRVLTPARENNQASPPLAPGASGRRTETPPAAAPVVAEAPPAKVAAPAAAAPKAPAPPPAALKAPAPAPAPAAPKAPVPVSVPVPAPAPAIAPAVAAKPIEPEPAARPAPVPPPTAQSPEPVLPEPASSPPPRPAARPAMPPPIVPASGAVNRATVTRLTEKVPLRPSQIPGHPPPPPAPPRPEKPEPAAAAVEPRARPPAPAAPAWPGAKSPPSGDALKSVEVRSVGDKPNPTPSVKAPAKVDDPFADLDSLEAEMARLLGREK